MDLLERHGILNDFFDKLSPGQEILRVSFSSGGETNPLYPTSEEMKNFPSVVIENAVEGKFYTLMVVDLDAPSEKNPVFRAWRHSLVTNIPGGDITMGEVVSEYQRIEPDPDTGRHRIVFALFEQRSGKIRVGQLQDRGNGRAWFKPTEFSEKYGLGYPISVAFFLYQHDTKIGTAREDLARIVMGVAGGGGGGGNLVS